MFIEIMHVCKVIFIEIIHVYRENAYKNNTCLKSSICVVNWTK